MDDTELTRLAIAEIVREMGEVKEPAVQERKINPIAKANKRFLGRTLNSVLSHNKRKNDRTQENCRRKLKELDERREIINRMKSRSRSGSWELVLSSSSDEGNSKVVRKRKQHERKIRNKKHKKLKKRKHKTKKNRRASSSSSESSSESSSTTSRSSGRTKKSKLRKKSKSKKRKILQPEMNTNEYATEETYYEPDINAAIEFDAALMANNYRQHQIQQLLYYNALMAGHETTEIDALKEELRISDAEVSETRKENVSICSAVSSLNLNESDSDGSEMLQISLSSATSSNSENKGNTSIKNMKVKRKYTEERLSSDSSDAVIWELDSDSSNGDKILEIKGDLETKGGSENQTENDDCICITSESETTTDGDSESESSTNENDIASANIIHNNVCHAAAETVTLLSSSDSEVEIITLNGADESAQKLDDSFMAAITPQSTDLTPASEQQTHLVLCVTETNGISIPKESLSTVIDDSVVTATDKTSNLSVDVNSLITTTECSPLLIKIGATESEMPICEVQQPLALMQETEKLEANESTTLTLVAPTNHIIEALCEPNLTDVTTAGTDVETTALKLNFDSLEADESTSTTFVAAAHPIIEVQCKSNSSDMTTVGTEVEATTLKTIYEQKNIISEADSNKIDNVPLMESVDEIPPNLLPSSPTDPSVSSSPALSSLTPITTIDNTELDLGLIQNQSAIIASESVDEHISS